MSAIGKNLVLVGMAGTFKSSAGKIAAQSLAMLFADSDAFFEFEYNMKISECFEKFGEQHFRKFESKIISHLSECEGIVIATGGGAVQDQKNADKLKKNGFVVWLRASARTVFERTGSSHSNKRPLLKGKSIEDIQVIIAQREPQYQAVADAELNTDGLTPEQTAQKIVDLWREHNCI